jgi:hypothetical protein
LISNKIPYVDVNDYIRLHFTESETSTAPACALHVTNGGPGLPANVAAMTRKIWRVIIGMTESC